MIFSQSDLKLTGSMTHRTLVISLNAEVFLDGLLIDSEDRQNQHIPPCDQQDQQNKSR
jgi:hypothetical protein